MNRRDNSICFISCISILLVYNWNWHRKDCRIIVILSSIKVIINQWEPSCIQCQLKWDDKSTCEKLLSEDFSNETWKNIPNLLKATKKRKRKEKKEREIIKVFLLGDKSWISIWIKVLSKWCIILIRLKLVIEFCILL